jgi:hypothetical protein
VAATCINGSAIRTKSSTSSWDEAIREVSESQRGRIARRQLLALGATRSRINRLTAAGRLIPVRPRVYAVGHLSTTHGTAWVEALLQVGEDASLSHASAAANLGVRRSASSRIDITCPRRLRNLDGINLHRRTVPADELTVVDDIPTTTVSRTIFDLASTLSDARLEWAISEAEKAQLDFTPSFTALLDRYPRHRGTVTLRRELFECDFAWPELRLVVEVDSREHHSDWAQQERDRRRDRVLAAHGWTVIRVTDRMLRFERLSLIADIERLMRR